VYSVEEIERRAAYHADQAKTLRYLSDRHTSAGRIGTWYPCRTCGGSTCCSFDLCVNCYWAAADFLTEMAKNRRQT